MGQYSTAIGCKRRLYTTPADNFLKKKNWAFVLIIFQLLSVPSFAISGAAGGAEGV